ncbi:hypothetical protein ESCO_004059 [Escovopsis weberi]|uniref:Uncharacterized protein n=1 Tax=Escovopsis weberi TaxID=150374 RepID=A0A0M9VVD5_ESCWE|nr:hypothetical protein ESCO_004059 [Escovopsis weberi]
MQFLGLSLRLALLSMATLMALPVQGCKCWALVLAGGRTNRPDITEKCCENVGGIYTGDDCGAHSIRDWMGSFARCCKDSGGFISDCKNGGHCC